MVKKPEGGEFFQIGPDGKASDIELHTALLGDDDKHTWDPNDPRQVAERVAAVKARVERRRRG